MTHLNNLVSMAMDEKIPRRWVGLLRLRRKAKGIEVSRRDFLDTKPLRNPNLRWEKNKDETITIFISYKKSRFASFFSNIPKEKKVMLDRVGSLVWNSCDGNHPVKKIAETIHQEYKLTMEEAESALRTYLNQLSERGIVGFAFPKRIQASLRKENEEKQRK